MSMWQSLARYWLFKSFAGQDAERAGIPTAHEAEALRAKEQADHKAWLRDNAESVVVPEHPAVTLLREIWERAGCPECHQVDVHDDDCPVTAILAASKPGERALSELLAEARAEGYAVGKAHGENLGSIKVEVEREACAQTAHEHGAPKIAAEIRARGGK